MAKNVDPLVRQIRALLNSYGAMPDDTLDKYGQKPSADPTVQGGFPILNRVLNLGYQQRPGLGSFFETDKNAIGLAIDQLRNGEDLLHGGMSWNGKGDSDLEYKKDSASNNLFRSLMNERLKMGMSRDEAYADVVSSVRSELAASRAASAGLADDGNTNTTVNPAVRQQLAAKAVGANTGQADSNWDTTGMAQQMMLKNYYDRGQADIAQYGNVAGLMEGVVPEQLKPIYEIMASQRMQEMRNNLDLTHSQMQAAPYVQMLKDAAADYRTQAKQSGSGSLSSLLGGAGGASGMTGAGLSGYGSNAGLDPLAVSRAITNNLSLGQEYGKRFSGWEKPVISNNQVTYLRDFVPRSNKAASLVPQIMAFLGQGG